jgi:hypothetical protein
MLSTQYESDRRYKEQNRDKINERSRERYAARKVLPFAPGPDVANLRRMAFLDALDELPDNDLREQIYDMIEATAAVLMRRGNLKEYAARNQATEFVSALVWSKATAPRRRATITAAIGD